MLLAPDDAELHFQRAGFLLKEHKLDEAQAALTRTIDLNPNQFEAYILQAQMAVGRGAIDEAERLQRSAGRIEPDLYEFHLSYRDLGLKPEAIAAYRKFLELAPADAPMRPVAEQFIKLLSS